MCTQFPECSDAFLRCFKWKDLNICKDPRFESYMKYGCAKTCSYCGRSECTYYH